MEKKIKVFGNVSNDKMVALKIQKFCKERSNFPFTKE